MGGDKAQPEGKLNRNHVSKIREGSTQMGYRFISELAKNIYRELPKNLDAARFSELYELMNPRTAVKDGLANYEITKEWRDFTAWHDNLPNAQRLKDFESLKSAVSSLEVQLSVYYDRLQQHGWKYDSSFSGELLSINERVKALSERIKTIKEGKIADVAGRLVHLENVGWKYSQGAAGIIEAAVAKPGQKGPRTPDEMLVEIRKAEAPFLSPGLRGDPLRGDPLRGGPAGGGHRAPPTPSQVPPRDPAVVLREQERKAEEGKPGEAKPDEGKPEERKPGERKPEVRKPRPLPEIPKGPLK